MYVYGVAMVKLSSFSRLKSKKLSIIHSNIRSYFFFRNTDVIYMYMMAYNIVMRRKKKEAKTCVREGAKPKYVAR